MGRGRIRAARAVAAGVKMDTNKWKGNLCAIADGFREAAGGAHHGQRSSLQSAEGAGVARDCSARARQGKEQFNTQDTKPPQPHTYQKHHSQQWAVSFFSQRAARTLTNLTPGYRTRSSG